MKDAAAFTMLMFAVFVAAFMGGTLAADHRVFPYPHIRDALQTLKAVAAAQMDPGKVYFGEYIEPTAFPAGDAVSSRWTIIDESAPRLPIIAYGGLNQYLELCPELGCLAVVFDAEGAVGETWAYRPAEIFADDVAGDLDAHEMITFDPETNLVPIGVARYADGDILVTLQAKGHIFPFGLGVARLRRDGTPRWTRADFSHHWPNLRADGVAYVPGLKIGAAGLAFTLGSEPQPQRLELECRTDRPQLDIVQLIDHAGNLIERIDLVPIFLHSNWTGLLPESTDFCDPLHLNFVDEIGADAGPGLNAGDLVVSLRNLSRFAILDRKTRQIKRVVSGGFIQQHSVQHLSGSKFLIFDNHGGDLHGPGSRIIELDLATGVERRIFPNARTPEPYARAFTATAGHLDISPDGSRVLASFTHAGRAFEIDIASGRLLSVFDNVHDLSPHLDLPEGVRKHGGRFAIYGMSYLRG